MRFARYLFLTTLTLTAWMGGSAAASAESLASVRALNASGHPTFTTGSLGTLDSSLDLGQAAEKFLDAYLLEASALDAWDFAPDVRFEAKTVQQDELGQAHVRLAQSLGDRRVLGVELIVHVRIESGEVVAVNGTPVALSEVEETAGTFDDLLSRLEVPGFSGDDVTASERVVARHASGEWRGAWRALVEREDGVVEEVVLDELDGERIVAGTFQDIDYGVLKGLAPEDAVAVMNRATTFYASSGADRAEKYVALLRSVEDLFGETSPEAARVMESIRASQASAEPGLETKASSGVTVVLDSECFGLRCRLSASVIIDPFSTVGIPVAWNWRVLGVGEVDSPVATFTFPGYRTYLVNLKIVFSSGFVTLIGRNFRLDPEMAVTPRFGNWYNPERNGNGIDIFRTSDGRLGLAWYTYLSNGTPIWYQSDVVAQGLATWSANLMRATWNGTSATLTRVGSVRLDFSNPDELYFSWTLDGQSGGEFFEFLFGGGGRDGAWFPPSEPGWGIETAEQSGTLGAVVTFYEGSQPRWVSGAAASGSSVVIPLRWRVGTGLCPSCSGGSTTPPSSFAAGTLTLQIASGSSTTGTATTAITTPNGATWNRGPVAIQLLTAP